MICWTSIQHSSASAAVPRFLKSIPRFPVSLHVLAFESSREYAQNPPHLNDRVERLIRKLETHKLIAFERPSQMAPGTEGSPVKHTVLK